MYAYARVMCIKKQNRTHKMYLQNNPAIYLTKNTIWNTDATLRATSGCSLIYKGSWQWIAPQFDLADFFIQWIHGWIPDATTDAFVCLHLLFSFWDSCARQCITCWNGDLWLFIYLIFLKSVHVFIILNWLPATRWKHLHCYAGITFPEIVMKMVAKSLHSALMVPSHMYMLLLHVYT